MNNTQADAIFNTYLHVQDGGRTEPIAVSESFWQEVAQGNRPDLNQGRLMSALTFSQPWPTWERHPAGEELVLLLAGTATIVLEESSGARSVLLDQVGAYVLVPTGVWHTAQTTVATTLLFLTPGAGTEHRPVMFETCPKSV
jgi:mannose-6-phosphate isomerase-like protein (cupin superfamily)